MSLVKFLSSQCIETSKKTIWSPLVTAVRYRYHADKVAKRPILRRHGYDDRMLQSGLLPRSKEFTRPLPLPLYRPKDVWSKKRALFGQNDYIDILGNENLHPTRLLYNLPSWIRAVKGNEYQALLRKTNMLCQTPFKGARPAKWAEIKQRISYLYRWLNRKTKTGGTGNK